MKKTASFALVSLLTMALFGWMLTYAFPTAADRHAIVVSAVIAYVVQLASFMIARAWAATNVVAGWGLGMLIRFVVLALYALVGVKVLHLQTTPALVSLAAFFFVSTLAEPVLLKS
jgi:heme/copper-type cytochrome/quinol oxidase subunit 4